MGEESRVGKKKNDQTVPLCLWEFVTDTSSLGTAMSDFHVKYKLLPLAAKTVHTCPDIDTFRFSPFSLSTTPPWQIKEKSFFILFLLFWLNFE